MLYASSENSIHFGSSLQNFYTLATRVFKHDWPFLGHTPASQHVWTMTRPLNNSQIFFGSFRGGLVGVLRITLLSVCRAQVLLCFRLQTDVWAFSFNIFS
ncbi:hypothetical protein GOODEAATRI_022660 [Goodea atripinnis]|uniref:Uncharacterized protein n=1 Tax=Goodea atripinnis TaxID=208336 RepID=A0ABV0NDR5_9TELE